MKPTHRNQFLELTPSVTDIVIYDNTMATLPDEPYEARAWKRAWNWLIALLRREIVG